MHHFVTLLSPLFRCCMLLQIRLSSKKLIHNAVRNTNYDYADYKDMKNTCTTTERANSEQFIILIQNLNYSWIKSQKQRNRKRSQYPN